MFESPIQHSLPEFVSWQTAGLLVYLASVAKLTLYLASSKGMVVAVLTWTLLSLYGVFTGPDSRTIRLVFLASVIWFLEVALAFATNSTDPALYDTPGFLREALYIEQAGGILGLLGELFSGQYPFFNRNPLIPYLCTLIRKPGFAWFVTGKALSVAGWGLGIIGLHYFTRRWFGKIEALLSVIVLGLFFPVVQFHAGWIEADLAVLGFVLLALGLIRTVTTTTVLLSGLCAGLGYWTKASAVFVLPVITLVIVLTPESRRERLRQIGIFSATWTAITSPLLTNNFLNHGNPLYNWNQRYLFVPRNFSGDASDTLSGLPHLSNPLEVLYYVTDGVLACLQGFWYFMDAPGPVAVGFVAAVAGGIALKLSKGWVESIPLLFAGLTFLAQGMNYYVVPRFMFFGWCVLIAYGSYGTVRLVHSVRRSQARREDNHGNGLRQSVIARGLAVVMGITMLVGVLIYYPRGGEIKTFLTSVKIPPAIHSLWSRLREEKVHASARIVDGPSSDYPLEYFGYRNTLDLPDTKNRAKLVDWLRRKNIRWMVVHYSLLRRRTVLQSDWLRLNRDWIQADNPPTDSPFCIEFSSPSVVLLSFSPARSDCPGS